MVMSKLRQQFGPVRRDIWLNAIVSSTWIPVGLRARLLARTDHDIHPSVRIAPGCFLGARDGLTIGEDSFVNYGCFFELSAPITIGRDVSLGYDVGLITTTHEVGPARRRAGAAVAKPITIGDGAWVGARAAIMPGVNIAPGTIVNAGAVVTRDTEPHGVYAGVPAKRTSDLDQVEAPASPSSSATR